MEHESHAERVKQNGGNRKRHPAQLTPEQVVAAMARTVQRVRQMSQQQRVQSLKDAGILTSAGKLAASYR